MKITNIEPQRNKNRVNIYVDNIFSIGIEEELRFKYHLEVGMEVTDEFIKEILKAEEQNKVTSHALNLLSYRLRSEKEIYMALKRKNFEDFYINNAIAYCKENNYINDKAFAEAFVHDKVNLNKLGPERIKYELILKGIPKEIIEDVLILDKDEQYDIALELAMKKLNSYKNHDKNSIYRKLSGFLQRKGYSYDTISKVMKEALKDR
ncbi:RecX family transcriptional regulator [Tissierella pigra]|uniref:Regulatory protein RecX n=1 Tax=Tissierella pigra TaxID=2607614 RepID=A0A6N7XJD9_9FIRM|nr:RecX family transcriptional regulator [Tissierella pigra]MBU5426376.1 RecX family transcriptional regulator [Tissierella pigra]MSU02201.1 recombination regulator RecX [Tissierella pigra]